MRFIGKIISNKKGVLTIDTDEIVSSLKAGEFYAVDIRPHRNARSLQQNAKLWALLQELADKTGNDIMDVYVSALEHADAKYTWIASVRDAEPELFRCFRAVKPFGTILTSKGQELVRYKCYIGSSRYNKSEMAKLIDFAERELYG